MTFLEKALAELVDIIEWTDDASDTLVWRFPRYENEIKYGAQLIVRQSQAAVFVNMGEIADLFTSGKHELTTKNLPLLTTLMGWKYGFQSPFKAEIYFVNTRNFTNLKWGTKNPVILRDPEFGPVRLRSFGTYVAKVSEPVKFVRQIVGTGGHFTVEDVADQLRNIIVTRFSDMLGESGSPILDWAARYDELSCALAKIIAPEFQDYGLEVTKLLVENISLPSEVEEALDKRSSMGIIGNLDNFMKFQSANAMTDAAKNPGGDASAGVGMGIGMAMASQVGKMMGAPQETAQKSPEPPPLPGGDSVKYFVGKSGKQAGPFAENEIAHYIKIGSITKETLLWKEGMEKWATAGSFGEFATLFRTTPPPLPK